MTRPHRPAIRGYLGAAPLDDAGRRFVLFDRLRLSAMQVPVSSEQLVAAQLLDGSRSLDAVAAEVRRRTGQVLPPAALAAFVQRLDEALFLDSPRYHAAVADPVRPPSCIGAYEGDPDELRQQLFDMFNAPGAAGLPQGNRADGRLRAMLVPHIDYARGGEAYTFGFRELVERSTASLFVVVGTSHYCPARFTLTRKHFLTPLGVMPTDSAFIDRVVARYGDGLFDHELEAHQPEHSIELEVVLLQYLLASRPDVRIVPLLVGPFADCVDHGLDPGSRDDIARMVTALREADRECGEDVMWLVSGDLAHIGPKFGDESLPDAMVAHSRSRDAALIRRLESADHDGYFGEIVAEKDARRICGLPPTWLTLAVTGATSGRRLSYGCYVHPEGNESVSFASVGFER